MSRETAYRARRRWPDFARLWDAALLHARARAEGELASRAYAGVKVPVFVRGECVATWRRHDPRYLGMLLARLDRKAEECPEAAETAARFDELLALHAGHAAPEGFAEAPEGEGARVPSRREYAAWCASAAAEGVAGEDEDRVLTEAGAEAGEAWDAWREGAFETVDAILRPFDGLRAQDGREGDLDSDDRPTPDPSRKRAGDSADTPLPPAGGAGGGPVADKGDAAPTDLPYEVKSAPRARPGSVPHVSTAPARGATIARLRKPRLAVTFRASEVAHGSCDPLILSLSKEPMTLPDLEEDNRR